MLPMRFYLSMIPYYLIICFILFETVFGVIIHEVNVGETVKLPCLSNDEDHRFQYWQLVNDEIIGPWNNRNNRKIEYEVTTGELTIKEVTSRESGFYKCISKALTGPSLHMEAVELIVKRDWEEEYDNDTVVNIYRGLIAFFCILICLLLGILAFVIARRKRSRGNIEESDDSPDETLPRSGGTYRPTTISNSSSGRKKKGLSNEALLGDTVDTDMRTSFPLPDYG